MKALSDRERRFVQAYLGDAAGNASKAALIAGYSAQSARRTAHRLTTKAHVRDAIEAQQGRLAIKAGFTAEQVISELATIAQTTPDKVSGSDKIKALELLGRAHGLFKDKQGDSRITVTIGFLTAAETNAPTVTVMASQPCVASPVDVEQ